MADVSVKMGVTGLSQFKQGMSQAQASIKSTDAALKLNEKQLKATGDAETYMQQKTTLLNQKLQAQKAEIANADGALRKMKEQGVDPLSKSYQDMQTRMLEAHAAMLDTQEELQNIGNASTTAAGKTDQLTNSLQGISKKMSLDQVISGIDRITDGMEKAAKTAIDLGKSIWDNIVDSAGYADDIATLASRLGLSTTEVQQMQYIAGDFEASAEDIGKAWKRVRNSMSSDSKDVVAMFKDLKIATKSGMTELGGYVTRNRDVKDVFWEIGEALMRMPDEIKREEYATKLLGKSWDELIPLFTAGREAYEEAMQAAPAASEKAVEQAASLSDRLGKLEKAWDSLKVEVIGGIAPALEKAAVALEGVINTITAYLQTDEGQKQLERINEALSGIFDSLLNFDPNAVISGVETVLTGITGAFEWIANNWSKVQTGILAIAGAFGIMKLTSLGLTIANLVNGFKGFGTGGQQPTGATPVVAPTAQDQGNGRFSPVAPITADTVILDTKLSQAGATGFVLGESMEIIRKGQDVAEEAKENYKEGHNWLDSILKEYNIDVSMPEIKTKVDQIQLDALMTGAQDEAYRSEIEKRLAMLSEELKKGTPVDIPTEISIPENSQEELQRQLNELTTTVTVIPILGGMGGGGIMEKREYANGTPYVPFDGMMAILHKGERVMTARENADYGRSYNSNLYVESMIMNNGTDAEGLAAAMAAAQRRITNGFGS